MGGSTKQRARAALAILAMVIVTTQAAAAPGMAKGSPGNVPLHIASESAVYHPETGNVDFTLQFDRRPNFRTVDKYGRKADSFQYYIVGDDTLEYPQIYDAIIRGDEINLRTHLLPIRNSWPSDPDPAAGGWGSIRAIVPYHLRGRVLTLSPPLTAVSDHSTDGIFTYIVGTYRFGSTVDEIVNESVIAS
ncbi:MAG: hypothetical protein QOH48_973 [Actinomycetota bacterium]|jgi:hypothetical protein|nr:hypothetical protein [Actinomycetota bacterium]